MKNRSERGWYALLVLPFLGLLFPAAYAPVSLDLWGVPFFYWYQIVWLFASSALTALVYARTR
jgi:hypothetical protein